MAEIPISPLAPAAGFPTLPAINGVQFATVGAAVKHAGRHDVMLASLAAGTSIAGVFTKSATRSAAVLDCQSKIGGDDSGAAAFLVNSGNANAFTGSHGQDAVNALVTNVASVLDIAPSRVFTASTGVIGEPLPHEKITGKLKDMAAGLSGDAASDAARAIMTTDTFPKGSSATFDLHGETVNIIGVAKGSGMIAPDMATMLSFVFTDAKIATPLLQEMLSKAVRSTFNCITVDSDTSTSDTLMLAATGTSNAAEITDIGSSAGSEFFQALHAVMLDLAHLVVRDGEGASKFLEIRVSGAKDDADAHRAAMAVANSPLVKTAIAGEDANWGRVVMAVGKSGAHADRDKLSIWFGDILVAENGWVSPEYSESAAQTYMKDDELLIAIDLGVGSSNAVVWTCDLTHGYISINADYRS